MSKPQDIYLVCGVPGSGKTWVCDQLIHKFNYVPHDNYLVDQYADALINRARYSNHKVLGEAPFRISVLIKQLEDEDIKVHPYFIIEPDYVIKNRYESRENRPIPKMHLTRIQTVKERARTYGAFSGTSREVLQRLRDIN